MMDIFDGWDDLWMDKQTCGHSKLVGLISATFVCFMSLYVEYLSFQPLVGQKESCECV